MYKKIIMDGKEWNYLIYDDGRVYSLKTKKFLSPDTSTGYARVLLSDNKIKKRYNIHTLVGIHFIPNPNNLPIINHKDHNLLNNNVSNLEWISYSDNVKQINCIKHKKLSNINYSPEELDGEEWRPFRDGRYWASNLGRLKNIDKNKILNGHVNPVTTYIRDNLFFRNGVKITIPRHHIVWECFHPNEPIEILNHIDGNKINNRLINLENTTISKNLIHSYRTLQNRKTRKCLAINLKTNESKIFFSIIDAANFINCQESTIRQALNREKKGENNITKGWKWYNLTNEQYEQLLKSSETIESITKEKNFSE